MIQITTIQESPRFVLDTDSMEADLLLSPQEAAFVLAATPAGCQSVPFYGTLWWRADIERVALQGR